MAPDNMKQKEEDGRKSTVNASVRPKRAVPQGYLHDLLQSRHMMKTVGLQGLGGRLKSMDYKLAKLQPHSSLNGKKMTSDLRRRDNIFSYNKTSALHTTQKLPELFEQRKRFLQKKKRQKEEVAYRRNPEKPVGLLSLPEDVLLKIVCFLGHEDIKPLFHVCKELGNTLENAVKFHFNYATPNIGQTEENLPQAKRFTKKRAVTAYADVVAHLKRGKQRNVVPMEAPGSGNSTGPRTLRFTPQTTPLSRQTTIELDFDD